MFCSILECFFLVFLSGLVRFMCFFCWFSVFLSVLECFVLGFGRLRLGLRVRV